MIIIKKSLGLLFVMALTLGNSTAVFAAWDEETEFKHSIPQVLIEQKESIVDGILTHEYRWKDDLRAFPRSTEDDQIALSQWVEHDLSDGVLRHRAAKISPNAGSSAWYGCSQTDYALRHYSRVRVVKSIGGSILADSGRVYINSGIVTARTPVDNLFMLDWDFALRSYWGLD